LVSLKPMRIENLNNAAFTLLEVLLSSVIFVISVAGVFATISAVRGPVANKENQLAAAVFEKQVLEALYSNVSAANANYFACSVNQNPCPDFALSVGAHQVTHGNLPSGLSWPPALIASNNSCDANGCLTYTVSCGDGSAGPNCTNPNAARRVDLNINWPSVV